VNSNSKIDIRDGNRYILEQLDITKDDLMSYFILNAHDRSSFITGGNTYRSNVISRFSKSDKIDDVFKLIDKDIVEIDASKSVIETDILINLRIIENFHQKEIDQAKIDQWKIDKIDTVNQYNKTINVLENDNAKRKTSISDTRSKIADQKEQLDQIGDLQSFDDEIKQLQAQSFAVGQDINLIQQDIDSSNQLLAEVNKIIQHSVECPNCSHEFNITDVKMDVTVARSAHKELTEEILPNLKLGKETKRKELDLIQNSTNVIVVNKNKNVDDKIAINSIINKLESTVNQYEIEMNRAVGEIDKLNNKIENYPNPPQMTYMDAEIVKLRNDNYRYEHELELFSKDREDLIYLRNKFDSFKLYLANTTIKAIQNVTNALLNEMASDIVCNFTTYKKLKSGKISDKIDITISRQLQRDIHILTLSGGEIAKVDTAIVLALQQLINIGSTQGLNLTFLDETLNALDPAGVKAIMTSLNKLDKTIFTIAHTVFDQTYSNILLARKENNITSLSYNE